MSTNLVALIVECIGEEQETVLICLATDKANTPQEQALWANITKSLTGAVYMVYQ
ncbi:DUF3693 domain-containing protein [Vibrio atypicus]|uniref:DUF3693 domain-containing protein n=1 Tax=Vibrio atypicus TaxID=558271 RepID=UPI003736B5AE